MDRLELFALPAAERDWAPVAAFVKVASDDPNVQDMVVAACNEAVKKLDSQVKAGAAPAFET